MTIKDQEFIKAADSGTRRAGLTLLSHDIVRDDKGFMASIVIGHHKTVEDAEEFIHTLGFMMQNQEGKTTDYDMWSFCCDGDDAQGKSYFCVGPSIYFERYGELGGDPRPYFQLPPALGFEYLEENRFVFDGQETDGRQLLLRLGMKEVFLES